jgi:phospholipid/cholesterol/gamma-HCH transport system permease protein
MAVAEASVIRVPERLDQAAVGDLMRGLDGVLAGAPPAVVLDLQSVESFDSAGLGAVVESMRRARERGVVLRLRGLSQPMLELFSLISVERLLQPPARARQTDLVTRVGGAFEPLWQAAVGVLSVAWQTARAVLAAPRRGRGLRLDRAVFELDHAACGALPILALISFLLGLVLAMQAYGQLRVWGAEIYIADMVGVSVTTEIGPLMTAIVLAARSASSNAAQLGSMVIGEEIDALTQMGVQPVRFLVVPKVLALAFATVALGLLFDAVSICGGALFASAVAGIEPGAYLAQTQGAVQLGDYAVGKLKCLVFGTCIGVVGCALGLRVAGGSEGVARATTNAVVVSIFLVIVIDAAFVAAQRLLLG